MSVEILNEFQTPQVQCEAGDIFVQLGEGGWWVCSWDGNEAWTVGDEPFETEAAAIAAAEEAEEEFSSVQYD